ncbi:MAG TPA: arginase family protein [Acidimicrobiales bacterium]|nr:arginase family protein [Acidimicrobiales bacterium]
MTLAADPLWPAASSLVGGAPWPGRRNVGLIGVSTYLTSVTPRSWKSTPEAVREALGRYSTWCPSAGGDLAQRVGLVDYGDVFDPDGESGTARVSDHLARRDDGLDLTIVLGGDNSATFHALMGLSGGDPSGWGLVTLDAHHDLREGATNGSPVRQLLAAGLMGARVAQVGLADFANSPAYARVAADEGITAVSRGDVAARGVGACAADAVEVAAKGGGPVYVDVDLDAADRAAVPGCPAALPGGLSADEVRRCTRAVCADPRVTAIDFTEVDVGRDSADQRTVRLVALCVLEALAGVGGRP